MSLSSELLRVTEEIGTSMVCCDFCPCCGGANLEAIACPNDLYTIDGVSNCMKESDYHACRDCGLIFARRRQSADSAARYYEWFAYLEQRNYAVYPPSEEYLELKSAATAKHIKYLTDRGILCPGLTIAHVRCDVGSLQVAIQKQFSGCIFHGYDYFDSNVRYARECGLETVNLLDPAQINLGEGIAFDLIICNHVFTHSMDPTSDRRTLFNALKPGGALYFYNEVNHQIRFKMGDDAYQWVALNNFHKQLLSPSCLTLFLIKGGFSDITLSNDGLYMRGLAYRNAWPPDPDYQRGAAAAAAAAAPDIEFNFRSWIKKRNSRFYSIFKLHQKIKRALHRQLRP